MSTIAVALKHMLASDMPASAIIAAVAEMEAALIPVRSARQERNARYYQKTRLIRLNSDVQDESDAPVGAIPKTKNSPTPPIKTQPISEPPSPPSGAHGSVLVSFSEFWSAYPRKEAKPKAKAAYDRALKRLGGPDPPGALLAALARAKLCRQWREGIIPHPATWLNRDPWDDEPNENERPHNQNSPTSSPDARRANTESRRGVWAELIAERDGVSAAPDPGPVGDGGGPGGVPGYPRLALAGYGG